MQKVYVLLITFQNHQSSVVNVYQDLATAQTDKNRYSKEYTTATLKIVQTHLILQDLTKNPL